jgi:hypothetical protein
MEAKLDPITDIFRTSHVTAFGQRRLEATAPWGLRGGGAESEGKAPNAGKQSSPTDLAHFAMLSCGNCWLNVEGIAEPIPLTGGDCMLLGHDISIVMRDTREHVQGQPSAKSPLKPTIMALIMNESRAIFTVASNVVFPLSCRFQRHTIIDTTAISHTIKQADAH